MRVAAAAVVAQRLYSGDADGNFRQPFAPGAAETVGDDDGDRQVCLLLECSAKVGGGAVWIFGKQQRVTASLDVGDVDAAVSAEKAMVRLGDQHAVFAPNDGAAFAQGQFDDAGVEGILFRPRTGFLGGMNRGEIDEAAFGL